MSNQYVNKVIYGNQTLIDLTGDNVSASDVVQGVTFHLPSGQQAVGTNVGGNGIASIITERVLDSFYSSVPNDITENQTLPANSTHVWGDATLHVGSSDMQLQYRRSGDTYDSITYYSRLSFGTDGSPYISFTLSNALTLKIIGNVQYFNANATLNIYNADTNTIVQSLRKADFTNYVAVTNQLPAGNYRMSVSYSSYTYIYLYGIKSEFSSYVTRITITETNGTVTTFDIPDGETGPAGQDGTDGVTPSITATATVGTGTSGNPTCIVTKTGTDAAPNFAFAFDNIKSAGGVITVNNTPVKINIEDLAYSFSSIPNNTLGTVQFVDANENRVKYWLYKDTNPYYQADTSTKQSLVHKVWYTFSATATINYLKIGNQVWLNGIPAVLSITNIKLNGLSNYALFVDGYVMLNRTITLLSLNTPFMGLNGSAPQAGLEFANLVFSEDYGWELISGMNLDNYPDLPGFDCLPKLTAVATDRSEDVLSFTSAMSSLTHWDTRSYTAEIIAYENGNIINRDWAKVTISQYDNNGQKIKVVCEPLNITGTTDLTAHPYYLNNPCRMQEVKM